MTFDVFLAKVKYEDDKNVYKIRPILISKESNDKFVYVYRITSSKSLKHNKCKINYLQDAGLTKESYIITDFVYKISKINILKKIGHLNNYDVGKFLDTILTIHHKEISLESLKLQKSVFTDDDIYKSIKDIDEDDLIDIPDGDLSILLDDKNVSIKGKENKNLKEELTKEQEEYFKNSKIRDEKGNLLVCYHGTTNPGFKEFNASKGKSQFGAYKFKDYNVNYFTTSKETARGYTKLGNGDVYACYLNVVNPYIVNNETESDIKSWRNIKDKNVRNKQIQTFDRLLNKWYNKYPRVEDLDEINKDFYPFGYEFRLQDENSELVDVYKIPDNSYFGNEEKVLSSYYLFELFDRNDSILKDTIIGEDEDDYYLNNDDIVKWVLYMNENEGTDYDGIIIPDILDVGPSGSPFSGNTTDIITLKSSNQIKLIDNKNPTSSSRIDEALSSQEILDMITSFFGTTDEPEPTAMYILPNGKFLFTTPLDSSGDYDNDEYDDEYEDEYDDEHDDYEYTADEHRNIDDFLYKNDVTEDDRYLEDDGSLFAENVLNCIRFNMSDDYGGNYSYIQLNKKQPTSQQYNALLKVFDYAINNGYKYFSIILDNQYGKQVKLELNNYTADEILKKIKRYYVSGILTENITDRELEKLFPNSKVRDSKNKLLKCYHSSNNDFDKFELRSNTNGRMYGSGIYFTTKDDYMFAYGNISYECYLDVKHPWYFNSTYEEIKNFVEKDTNEAVNEIKLKEYYAKGYGSDTTILDYYENVIKEIGITFKDLLIRNNYDGIIVCEDRDELEYGDNEIVVFNPNQVKLIKKYYNK